MDIDKMPRERLFQFGVQALEDYELLAILLKTGTKEYPIIEFSKKILKERAGILGLLNSQIEDLENIKGLGKAKIAEILVIIELCKRYSAEKIKKPDWQFHSIDDVKEFLMVHYKGLKNEVLGLLLLDQQNYYMHYEVLAVGSCNQVNFPWKKLAKAILQHQCAAAILIHNHPAGGSQASQADILITEQAVNFLAQLEVRLLDHLIVAHHDIVSLKAGQHF